MLHNVKCWWGKKQHCSERLFLLTFWIWNNSQKCSTHTLRTTQHAHCSLSTAPECLNLSWMNRKMMARCESLLLLKGRILFEPMSWILNVFIRELSGHACTIQRLIKAIMSLLLFTFCHITASDVNALCDSLTQRIILKWHVVLKMFYNGKSDNFNVHL